MLDPSFRLHDLSDLSGVHSRNGSPWGRTTCAAVALFKKTRRQSWLTRLLAWITGRPYTLLSVDRVLEGRVGNHQIYAGQRSVPLARIVGSENRCHDFDRSFRPLQDHTRERWIGIAAAMLRAQPMPAVELIQVGDNYFVRDGHHRISVARALGYHFIDAQVTLCQVPATEDLREQPTLGHRQPAFATSVSSA